MITQHQKNFIIENYSKKTVNDIAKILDIKETIVKNWINRNGIYKTKDRKYVSGNSKYSQNEFFFNKFTNKSCYYAGFIGADGTILYGKDIKIGQAEETKEILEKFVLDIESNRPIHGPYKIKHASGVSSYYEMLMRSSKICKDLELNFNIIQNKTLILQPPTKIQKLENKISYICGSIDGDGWVSKRYHKKNRRHYLHIGFSGTFELLDWIHTTLKNNLNIQGSKIYKSPVANCYSFEIFGEKAENFLSWVIKNNIQCYKINRLVNSRK